MRIKLELPITTVTYRDRQPDGTTIIHTARAPDFFGARARWGQVEDRGGDMLVEAEIDPDELAKIPEQHRR